MKRDDNLEERNTGELMTRHYNACVNGDVAEQDQIEAEMESRGWTVDFDGRHNPSWTDNNVEDEADRSPWHRLFGI